MKMAIVLSAGLAFLPSEAAATGEAWQYMLIFPDGTRGPAPAMDLSYPPLPAADEPPHPRQHLIIIEPENGRPEPLILSNQSPNPKPAPAKTPQPAEPDTSPTQAATVQPAAVRPTKRTFILY